jgi:hypothetical protein
MLLHRQAPQLLVCYVITVLETVRPQIHIATKSNFRPALASWLRAAWLARRWPQARVSVRRKLLTLLSRVSVRGRADSIHSGGTPVPPQRYFLPAIARVGVASRRHFNLRGRRRPTPPSQPSAVIMKKVAASVAQWKTMRGGRPELMRDLPFKKCFVMVVAGRKWGKASRRRLGQ